MEQLAADVVRYVEDTRRLAAHGSTTEATYYPAIRDLIAAILRERRLPFDIRTGTSEVGAGGTNFPDFVLADRALFVGVFGEVKRPGESLEAMAASTEHGDQIGRYLARTGTVVLSNVRGFGLLVCAQGYERTAGAPVPPSQRELIATADLWSALSGSGSKARIDPAALADLVELVERAVTDHAPIADPADLAKVLARQARDAKDSLPEDLRPVTPLLDDYRQALGLAFEFGDPKGDRFFRSSLVQTVFYSLFAAWILWDRKRSDDSSFDLEQAQAHLRLPFLEELFYDLRRPQYLQRLDLSRHLERAVATLNRVDRILFRQRLNFPRIDDEAPTVAAITYFYEPFLEAFDPELRADLGVWYTPPEIVRYQVRRVHHLLKTELGIARGLADPEVVVLDPCCGTGAYLLEVARCIAAELRAEGDRHVTGQELRSAFTERVIGFEILTAPFAIAQLQLLILLSDLGAEIPRGQRLAVYLTNALTGWHDPGEIKLTFPEMREEFTASQGVKRDRRIIVVLGNPPYDRFAGVAQAEEAELVAHYKGIELVIERDSEGRVRQDEFDRPRRKQRGQSLLYKEFGVRKQLLDDLYIRFIRLAEQRIGEAADRGIVSFITNSSYLTGRSHPLMRRSLLTSFHKAWIDNLNGDKFRTGKLIPRGLSGAGTADQSAFTTDADPRGIQPGTAIVTWLKLPVPRSRPEAAEVLYRDLWGLARWKRQALLSSLPGAEPSAKASAPTYLVVAPTSENRWRLSPRALEAGYEDWPGLDEMFPVTFQAVFSGRGLTGSWIDVDRDALRDRMIGYFGATDFDDVRRRYPELTIERPRYPARDVWEDLRAKFPFSDKKIVRFLTFPFDQRWVYYEPDRKVLDERSPRFWANRERNEFLITVPEPRKASETRPLYSTTLVNLHVHERGSVVFPRETRGDDLLSDRDANLAEAAWRTLSAHLGLSGLRRDLPARALVGDLFRVALAVLHAPAYQADHRSALAADWAHLPVPKDHVLFRSLVAAGEQVARLLDANRDATDVVRAVLGAGPMGALGRLSRRDEEQVRDEDLNRDQFETHGFDCWLG